MSESLVTYLQDYLTGASHALDLLSWMSDAHKDDSSGAFASTLHAEITKDRDVLVGLAQRLAAGSSATKETGAWLSEKIRRLKLADQGASAIGTFESLEFLVLEIHGKRALWQALNVIARADIRLARSISVILWPGQKSRKPAWTISAWKLRRLSHRLSNRLWPSGWGVRTVCRIPLDKNPMGTGAVSNGAETGR